MPDTNLVSGAAGSWLSSRREELNARFRAAKRRFPKLDAQNVLSLNAEFLPPLAGKGEPGSGELLSELFDLIILHSGRGLLSLAPSPMRTLLSDAFVRARPLLLQRPRLLPSALSNAVENLGDKGEQFVRGIGTIAPLLQNAEQMQDAGAVVAWRLGEARLRDAALKAASQLPNAATLAALGLDDWPASAAPIAVAALRGDSWTHPRDRITAATLKEIAAASSERILALMEKLAGPSEVSLPMTPAAPINLQRCGDCGEFAGFGGYFLEPPKLLYAGKLTGRHRFWVRSGTENFRIDADLFGWVCKPDATADFPIQESVKNFSALKTRPSSQNDRPTLIADGLFYTQGRFEKIAELSGANSFIVADELLAATLPDSFRVRVFAPARAAI